MKKILLTTFLPDLETICKKSLRRKNGNFFVDIYLLKRKFQEFSRQISFYCYNLQGVSLSCTNYSHLSSFPHLFSLVLFRRRCLDMNISLYCSIFAVLFSYYFYSFQSWVPVTPTPVRTLAPAKQHILKMITCVPVHQVIPAETVKREYQVK